MSTKKDKLDHSPVSLAPGSYDFKKLRRNLGKAAEVDPDKRAERVAAELGNSREDSLAKNELDQGARPDQKRKTVKRGEIEESVLVHDAGSDEAEKAAERADADAEQRAEQQRIRAERGSAAPTPAPAE